jgi:predicted Zn-dependent protease
VDDFGERPVHKLTRILLAFWLAVLVLFGPTTARALSLLRDAEVEHALKLYTADILEAARLEKEAVSLYLVNDPTLNAFVGGGQNIFMHSGLLEEAETPDEVIGVIAHETGHIIGGHLTRSRAAMKQASRKATMSFILGALAAAAGSPDAAMAILMKGQQVAGAEYMKYSRVQESAADQAAIRLLRQSGKSPQGFRDFMAKLQSLEISRRTKQVSYSRSHPLTRERVSGLDAAIARSPYEGTVESEELVKIHQRVRAKLFGFLHSMEETLNRYPQSDQSIPARYARAIAYHGTSQLRPALAEINSLLVDLPDDGFFLELKGQMYYEHGRFAEAVQMYSAAAARLPHEPLILAALGIARLDLGEAEQTKLAITDLVSSLAFDDDNILAWLKLAVAYNDNGNAGMANLATAERYVRMGMRGEAMQQAKRAIRKLPEGTTGWIRAHDIQNYIRALPRPRRRRG